MTATILFWFAFAILTSKWLWLSGQKRQCETLRDEDLAPNHSCREQSSTGCTIDELAGAATSIFG